VLGVVVASSSGMNGFIKLVVNLRCSGLQQVVTGTALRALQDLPGLHGCTP
jgi:hypothetical protein